jgi:urease subunit alpha
MYGPTKGDLVRLGDTSLVAEIERDFTVYGDELTTGAGKSMRDGEGFQTSGTYASGALDLVVQNATIIDAVVGIVKADIGVRDGRIVGIGKAGNPDVMDGGRRSPADGPEHHGHSRRLLHRDRRAAWRATPTSCPRSSASTRSRAASPP